MRAFCQNLESRTLFSAGSIAVVTSDYDAVVADAGAIKADFTAAALTYKTDSKLVAADIKALGKNKTNSADISKLNKSVAVATALDAKITGKLIAVGRTALVRAKAAFVADVARPTTANGVKLSKALTTLTTALAPYELTLGTDTAAGDAGVDAALATLVAANPTDTALSSNVSTSEAASSSVLASLAGVLITTNNDVDTLAAAVS